MVGTKVNYFPSYVPPDNGTDNPLNSNYAKQKKGKQKRLMPPLVQNRQTIFPFCSIPSGFPLYNIGSYCLYHGYKGQHSFSIPLILDMVSIFSMCLIISGCFFFTIFWFCLLLPLLSLMRTAHLLQYPSPPPFECQPIFPFHLILLVIFSSPLYCFASYYPCHNC